MGRFFECSHLALGGDFALSAFLGRFFIEREGQRGSFPSSVLW